MSIQEVKILPLEEVNDKDFKPYGQIMRRETGEPYETLEILKYWTKNAGLGPENEKSMADCSSATRAEENQNTLSDIPKRLKTLSSLRENVFLLWLRQITVKKSRN